MTIQSGATPADALAPASGRVRTWFNLHRHEGDTAVDGGALAADDDGLAQQLLADAVDAGDTGSDPAAAELGDAGKKALAAMKAERAAAKRELAAAQAKLREYEDRDKTDLERATSAQQAAEQRAAAATARAVTAEVRALAADQFADPADAVAFLQLDSYVDAAGDVNADAIRTDLAELLARKPHLAKAPARTGPRPDPSQGAGRQAGPTDFRTASLDQLRAELAKHGVRLSR